MITSLVGSIATPLGRLVPYFDPPPPGRSSAPSKHTFNAPLLGFSIPHLLRTAWSGTPRHTEVDTPAAPQLNPFVCFVMFCSLRRFPAHTSVTGSSRDGNSDTSWSIVKTRGCFTRPVTSTVHSLHVPFGTYPWFRT